MSSGAICDVAMLKYHYKYKGSKTKIIIFKNTISKKLPKEIEEDLGDNLKYINKVSQLKRILK
jgi:ABC-type ATPase with predicted acetyltransferase domain